MNFPANFRWWVAGAGYRWTGPLDDRVLVPIGTKGREYEPLEERPAFFLTLAAASDAHSFQRVAGHYGLLGLAAPGAIGEALGTWVKEAGHMHRLVTLWDLLVRPDTEPLGRVLRWDGKAGDGGAVVYELDSDRARGDLHHGVPIRTVIASPADRPEVVARFREGDVLGAGWEYLLSAVEARLRDQAYGPVVPRFAGDAVRGRPKLEVGPSNLAGAAWLQFAAALAGEGVMRCETCGVIMPASAATARSHKRYCSSACRMKAYFRRQTEARQMAADGQPFDQIAAALGSDEATVRKWVTGRRG